MPWNDSIGMHALPDVGYQRLSPHQAVFYHDENGLMDWIPISETALRDIVREAESNEPAGSSAVENHQDIPAQMVRKIAR